MAHYCGPFTHNMWQPLGTDEIPNDFICVKWSTISEIVLCNGANSFPLEGEIK